MGSGGNWKVQNKIRPGAYINFVNVPKPVSSIGDRGVMTAAMPMTWGPSGKLIELLGTDLLDGKSLAKIGCTAFNTEQSLPYRLALSGCYKALLYRADAGGVKASATLGNLTIAAKYFGTTGNAISIVIVEDKPEEGSFTLSVLVNGVEQENFVITVLGDCLDIVSDWVDFTVAEGNLNTAPTATAGLPLTNGTNGAVSADYTEYFDLISSAQWQCMAIVTEAPEVAPLILAKIKSLREEAGKKVQAVIANYNDADYEGVIATKQGFKTLTDIVSVSQFPLFVASLTAGAGVTQSNTAAVVPNATEITGFIADGDVADNLRLGWFLLSYRQDGVVIIEQDINSLHTFTVDKGYAFCKNRAIRCMDEIGNTAALVFNRNYAGKIDNDDMGRNIYKSELTSYIETLQSEGAVTNFDGAEDITVLPGEALDAVVIDLTIQPVDSIEKLYMTVNIDA